MKSTKKYLQVFFLALLLPILLILYFYSTAELIPQYISDSSLKTTFNVMLLLICIIIYFYTSVKLGKNILNKGEVTEGHRETAKSNFVKSLIFNTSMFLLFGLYAFVVGVASIAIAFVSGSGVLFISFLIIALLIGITIYYYTLKKNREQKLESLTSEQKDIFNKKTNEGLGIHNYSLFILIFIFVFVFIYFIIRPLSEWNSF
jgi:Ca2+/Na+ antiporter